MPDNVHKFRRIKWADPKRFKMIDGFKSKPRGSLYFSGLIVLCVLIGLVAALAWPKFSNDLKIASPTKSVSAPASISVYVVDGDTIGLGDGGSNVRLVGFNAPETGNRARCEAERQKGEAAQRRLRELVNGGRPDFQQVACSCPVGTEGTNACNFGRRCGTLRVNGVDVGSTLIGEGLAVRFVCGATSCPALPRPWC
ncbi:thermonuclease family protein [Bradyrhizobium sp. AUGA SZCCT0177]|uniref:thermonuclease family protein n=1 Tax=Bradyrhizobium sp. AUGA SZCCT0177 TaxID=2807665 RepID=UPI001BA778EB|nr:thermonuclease family protein [Bradyrhizobium sp. AUGA SZCCT0177]MBR1286191.1 thermonuclease family protein [Bradyrhizobium sp. AUGA SZCCT0177]